MANTITALSYANTFGDWLVATDALINENNILAAGDYTKNSGTLYLDEATQNSLQANGNIVVQKQLLVQGIGSSATIQNNLTVGRQVYFTNSTLGLTHTGQANLDGLVLPVYVYFFDLHSCYVHFRPLDLGDTAQSPLKYLQNDPEPKI